jgi:predicted RNase H-like HicB family nuclease
MAPQPEKRITFVVPIVVEVDGDGYHAYCPVLRGLHTCGATEDEALAAAVDAAVLYLESLIRHNDSISLEVCREQPHVCFPGDGGTRRQRYTRELSVAVA